MPVQKNSPAPEKPEPTPQERAENILESIERQMRGAANAAKRAGGLLTKADVSEETRERILALLEPMWADVQAGVRGVKVASNGTGPSLLARAAETPTTASKAGKK